MRLPLALAALVLVFGSAPAGDPAKSVPREVLPFIADDYSRALSEARARDLPIFVECWAPW